ALLAGLEDETGSGKACTPSEGGPDGVPAYFDDGWAAAADILVGAAGVHSRVGRQRIPGAEPRHTGIVGIFGRTPLTRVNLSVLGPMLSNAGIMAIGSRGRVCFCTAMRFL